MSITLITACDESYKPAYNVLRAYRDAYGWNEYFGDLGGVDKGTDYSEYDIARWAHKPSLILAGVNKTLHTNNQAIYLDADAFPIQPIEHIFRNAEWDIMVTVRADGALDNKSDESVAFMGWTNAGVIGLRNTTNCIRFINQWQTRMTDDQIDDQTALNQLLHGDHDRPQPYSVQTRYNAKVLFLPEEIYNYGGDLASKSPFTKIVHLKGKRWQNHLKTLRTWAGLQEPIIKT